MKRRECLLRGSVLSGGLAVFGGCSETPSTGKRKTGSPVQQGTSTPDDEGGAGTSRNESFTDWSTFRYDNANTGFAQDADGPATGEQQWRFETNGETATPAVKGGLVFVGSGDDNLYALDAASGDEQWRYASGFIATAPAVADATVYVTDGSGFIHAVNATTGEQVWRSHPDSDAVSGSAPTVADGTLFTGIRHRIPEGRDQIHIEHSLYAYDASDGTVEWKQNPGGAVSGAPAIVEGTVYIGTREGAVVAFDASEGTEQWSTDLAQNYWDSTIVSAPAVAGDSIYVGGRARGLIALDTTGSERWRSLRGENVRAAPAVADGSIYAGTRDGAAYAIDRNGTERWRVELGDAVMFPPAVAGGTVYFSAKIAQDADSAYVESILYALAVDDGAVRWRSEGTTGHTTGPVIAGGTLFVGGGVQGNGLLAVGG